MARSWTLRLFKNGSVRDLVTDEVVGSWHEVEGEIRVNLNLDRAWWQGKEEFRILLTLTGLDRLNESAKKPEQWDEIDDVLAFVSEERPGCSSKDLKDVAKALQVDEKFAKELIDKHLIFVEKAFR